MNVRENKFIDVLQVLEDALHEEREWKTDNEMIMLSAYFMLIADLSDGIRSLDRGCDVRVRLYYLSLDAIDIHTHLAAVRHQFFFCIRSMSEGYLSGF